MKIAYVSDAIYPYNKGGKEKRLFEISTRLSKKGEDVHIYCMKWWNGKSIRKENGVTLHAISSYYPLYSGERRSIKQAILFSLACLKLIKEDFDVIDIDHMPHLVLFTTKIVCVLKRKKMCVTWNEVWGRRYWKEYLGAFGNVAYIIEKLSSLLPNIIISVSKHTREKLINDLFVKSPVYTVENGVDIKKISKVKPSKTKSDVIYVGRLLTHKNIDILIKSIALLKKTSPSIKCLIVGDGPERKNLEKLSKLCDTENNISFTGFVENQDDLFSLMKSSKIFILPSTREGFSIITLEANACGIPVVTTNSSNNAAKDLIIQGQNGRISKLSPESFATSIEDFLLISKTPSYYKEFSKKFDWDKKTEELVNLYLRHKVYA